MFASFQRGVSVSSNGGPMSFYRGGMGPLKDRDGIVFAVALGYYTYVFS